MEMGREKWALLATEKERKKEEFAAAAIKIFKLHRAIAEPSSAAMRYGDRIREEACFLHIVGAARWSDDNLQACAMPACLLACLLATAPKPSIVSFLRDKPSSLC